MNLKQLQAEWRAEAELHPAKCLATGNSPILAIEKCADELALHIQQQEADMALLAHTANLLWMELGPPEEDSLHLKEMRKVLEQARARLADYEGEKK
jgi:hypothetical protein